MSVHGIVLAAGRSLRAGTRKARALVQGESLLARAVATLRAGGCDDVTVVLGEDAATLAALVPDAHTVVNPRVDDGMLRSLQLGLADAAAARAAAAVVALVDHPHVRADTVRSLRERFVAGGATVVVPVRTGTRGHPFLISAVGFDHLTRAAVDRTVRDVIGELGPVAEVHVDDEAVLEDLDTPGDLARAGVTAVR
ncbi:MAG: NTP transferase domain-containing protein [Deltaproteobacteria bacterium]|nr:NTP transferase domain-containing protein [Deltaproteobacteria bacterium]